MEIQIADLFEGVVDTSPTAEAVVCGREGRAQLRMSYEELEGRANRAANAFAALGLGAGDHVGIHLYNGIEWIEAMLGLFKLRAVPVNVNYRYVEGELDYLFDNSDIVALLFERRYADRVATCAPRHEKLTTLVSMPDPTDSRSSSTATVSGLCTAWPSRCPAAALERITESAPDCLSRWTFSSSRAAATIVAPGSSSRAVRVTSTAASSRSVATITAAASRTPAAWPTGVSIG